MQEDAYTGHPFCVLYKVFNCHTFINFTYYSGWHRASTGHQPHGTFPSVAFVETMSEKLWTGQVPKPLDITLTHPCIHFKISKRTSIPRIVYLTNLDYRQGLINFEDLNSNKSYDPSTAFYQASSWSLSLLHECFQSQLANILAVQSLSKEFLDDKVTFITYKMMKQE